MKNYNLKLKNKEFKKFASCNDILIFDVYIFN